MQLPYSYFTIENAAEGIYKDKGSKFLAFVFAVNSEEDVKQKLKDIKKDHPSARHYCYAWKVGMKGEVFRANDDGEPSGTAGKPILSQIEAKGVTNVIVIVVRYFGGTLLGTSGLVNAYRSAAADALARGGRMEVFLLNEYKIEFGHEDTGSVMHLLKDFDAKIVKQDFVEANVIIFTVRKKLEKQLEKKATKLFRAKIEFMRTL